MLERGLVLLDNCALPFRVGLLTFRGLRCGLCTFHEPAANVDAATSRVAIAAPAWNSGLVKVFISNLAIPPSKTATALLGLWCHAGITGLIAGHLRPDGAANGGADGTPGCP